jgi:site-specific recombinase XerD
MIENMPVYLKNQQPYFNLLYLTGCRPKELLQINLWSQPSEDKITLLPLKNNDKREFKPSDLPAWWIEAVNSQINPLTLHTVRQYRFTFNRVFKYANCAILTKQVELYLFRHNRFKQLSMEGYPVTTIREIMGEKTLSIVNGYINSVITYEE